MHTYTLSQSGKKTRERSVALISADAARCVMKIDEIIGRRARRVVKGRRNRIILFRRHNDNEPPRRATDRNTSPFKLFFFETLRWIFLEKEEKKKKLSRGSNDRVFLSAEKSISRKVHEETAAETIVGSTRREFREKVRKKEVTIIRILKRNSLERVLKSTYGKKQW